jgi:glycopeptide antibiotics resistance protein
MLLSNTSRFVWLTTLLYSVFVIYGSLVPLEPSYIAFDEAWQRFKSIPFMQLGVQSRSDWVANGVLFFPLAYLWLTAVTLKRKPDKISRLFLIALATAVGGLLSALIEFTQLYFPQRTVSQNDIVAEIIGAFLGSVAWYATNRRFVGWIDGWTRQRSAGDIWRDILIVYIGGLLFYAVMPLDLYLSPVELYKKWKEGRVHLIPLAGSDKGIFLIIYEIITDIAIWIPVPMLLSKYREFSRRHIWWLTVALASGIEFFQLFVYSRTSDITDIFTAGIGAAIGLCFISKSKDEESLGRIRFNPAGVSRRLGVSLTLAWLAIVFVAFWYPFNFEISAQGTSTALENYFSVPFQSYYFGTEYRALTELLRKILLMIPLGILIGLISRPRYGDAIHSYWALVLWLAAIATVFVLELGQAFLPERWGNITDATLGCLGLFLGRSAWRLYEKTKTSDEGADIIARNKGASIRYDQPAPVSTATVQADPGPPVVEWNVPGGLFLLIVLLVVSTVASTLLESSAIPYNIRELVEGDYRWLRVVGMILTAYWVFGIPMTILLRRINRETTNKYKFPGPIVGLIAIHTLTTWVLVWLVFPLESIHDITGAPVWQSFKPLELTLRFIGLFLFISTIIWSASAILVSQIYRSPLRKRALLTLLIMAFLVAYFVVIRFAGTDNLIELLPYQGRSWASIFIPAYLMLLVYCGLSLSLIRWFISKYFWIHVLVLFVSGPVGYWLLQQGLEGFVIKYGKVFSAMQFLLSANRDSYLEPQQLFIRFCIVHYALMCLIFLLQSHLWLRAWSCIHKRKKFWPILRDEGEVT